MSDRRLERLVAAAYLVGLLVALAGFVIELTASVNWGSGLLGLGVLLVIAARFVSRRWSLSVP